MHSGLFACKCNKLSLSLIVAVTHFSVSVLEKQKLNYKTFIFNKML